MAVQVVPFKEIFTVHEDFFSPDRDREIRALMKSRGATMMSWSVPVPTAGRASRALPFGRSRRQLNGLLDGRTRTRHSTR